MEAQGEEIMTDRLLEEILVQLGTMNDQLTSIEGRLERYTADLSDFSERFEEVIERLEEERRLDRFGYTDD